MQSGERLGRYTMRREIGEGGIAQVFVAADVGAPGEDAKRGPLALKVLRKEFLSQPSTIEIFLSEPRALQAVEHENTIQVIDVVAEAAQPYFVTELLKGRTLAELLKQRGALPVARVLRIARQVAQVLAHAHDADVVHRNVKPTNVFLVDGGPEPDYVKLLELGAVRMQQSNEGKPVPGTLIGTPAYMAPEQLRQQAGDHRVDMYSFGVLLFEIVTGRKLFLGDVNETVRQHLLTEAPRARSLVATIPQKLDDLIAQCLKKDPAQRPPSMHEIDLALRVLTEGSPAPVDVNDGPAPSLAVPKNTSGYTTVDAAIANVSAPAVAPVAAFDEEDEPSFPTVTAEFAALTTRSADRTLEGAPQPFSGETNSFVRGLAALSDTGEPFGGDTNRFMRDIIDRPTGEGTAVDQTLPDERPVTTAEPPSSSVSAAPPGREATAKFFVPQPVTLPTTPAPVVPPAKKPSAPLPIPKSLLVSESFEPTQSAPAAAASSQTSSPKPLPSSQPLSPSPKPSSPKPQQPPSSSLGATSPNFPPPSPPSSPPSSSPASPPASSPSSPASSQQASPPPEMSSPFLAAPKAPAPLFKEPTPAARAGVFDERSASALKPKSRAPIYLAAAAGVVVVALVIAWAASGPNGEKHEPVAVLDAGSVPLAQNMKPSDTKPSDTKPVETKPKPVETKPVETKPVEPVDAGTVAIDTKPPEKTPETKPVETAPPGQHLVTFGSTPAGAQVWIRMDKRIRLLCKTPCSFPLPHGKSLLVELRLDGYSSAQTNLTVDEGAHFNGSLHKR